MSENDFMKNSGDMHHSWLWNCIHSITKDIHLPTKPRYGVKEGDTCTTLMGGIEVDMQVWADLVNVIPFSCLNESSNACLSI